MRFRLVRYFTITSLVAIVVVAVSLAAIYRHIATERMLSIQESTHVTLTRVFSNTLGESHLAPFLRSLEGKSADEMRAAPQIAELDRKVGDLVRNTSVFKIKVFDLAGRTAYSSEHKQIGEDKSKNAGFLGAKGGTPRSELTHRDTFSAFEGVVENRDLISSYLPLYRRDGSLDGVFEIYSDVTPFLAEIARTQWLVAGAVAALMLLLYGALFAIAKRAENIIHEQDAQRERAQQLAAQSEKMAALGQMVAGVAHQLNTPIAFMKSNAEMMLEGLVAMKTPADLGHRIIEHARTQSLDEVSVRVGGVHDWVARHPEPTSEFGQITEMLRDMSGGLDQMSELVQNLRDFTRVDRAKFTAFDVNAGLRNVVYIAKSSIPTRITVLQDFAALPDFACSPTQLNQVFLNLVNNAAQAIEGTGTITVRSRYEGGAIRVDVVDTGKGIPPDVLPRIFESYFTTKAEGTGLGLPIAREIARSYGGDIRVESAPGAGTTFTVLLPCAPSATGEPHAGAPAEAAALAEAD